MITIVYSYSILDNDFASRDNCKIKIYNLAHLVHKLGNNKNAKLVIITIWFLNMFGDLKFIKLITWIVQLFDSIWYKNVALKLKFGLLSWISFFNLVIWIDFVKKSIEDNLILHKNWYPETFSTSKPGNEQFVEHLTTVDHLLY